MPESTKVAANSSLGTFKPLQSSEDLHRMQKQLSELGFLVDASGLFDDQTRKALVQFQTRRALPNQNGAIDQVTLRALSTDHKERKALDFALDTLHNGSTNFAARFVKDAEARKRYIALSEATAKEILTEVDSGKISPAEGAQTAHSIRNEILDQTRQLNSDIGRAYSEKHKLNGDALSKLENEKAFKRYNKPFSNLSWAKQTVVHRDIVVSAGRPHAGVTRLAKNLGRAGRGLLVMSAASSVHNLVTSDNLGRAVAKEGSILGGGFLGAMGGGAVAGTLCGPAAPVCSGAGVLIGGGLAAFGADIAFDELF